MGILEKLKIRKESKPQGPEPIRACIGLPLSQGPELDGIMESATYVNFEASPEAVLKEGMRGGFKSYVISAVDAKDKKSGGYHDCTAVAAVGRDRETGENISFLSHQFPGAFLETQKVGFEKDLRESLSDLIQKSKPNTIDIVLFGGKYLQAQTNGLKTFSSDYVNSIKHLGAVIKDASGIDPHVVIGPNTAPESVQVLLDTKHRRLYMERPEQDGKHIDGQDTGGFLASEIEKREARWLAKRKGFSIDEAA